MKRYAGAIVCAVMAMLADTGPAAAQCCGDCNGDNQVTVDEIVTAISRALSGCSNDGVCDGGGVQLYGVLQLLVVYFAC